MPLDFADYLVAFLAAFSLLLLVRVLRRKPRIEVRIPEDAQAQARREANAIRFLEYRRRNRTRYD